MTPDEAIATMRARWDHPELDQVDVMERVALRFDGAVLPVYSTVVTPPAVRLFRHLDGGGHISWYVHSIYDVDAAIDALETLASDWPKSQTEAA